MIEKRKFQLWCREYPNRRKAKHRPDPAQFPDSEWHGQTVLVSAAQAWSPPATGMPHLHGRKKDKGKSSNGKIPWDQYGYPLFCIRVKLRSRYGSNQHSSIIAQIVTFSGNTDDAIISCRENTSESSTIQVFQRKRFWFPVIFICNRPFIAVSLNRDKTTLRLFFSEHDRWRTAAQVRGGLAGCRVSTIKKSFVRMGPVRKFFIPRFSILQQVRIF